MSAERSEGAPRSSLLRQEAGFVQKGFGLRSAVAGSLEADYRGYAVEALRALGNSFDAGPITVHLAKEFGFCYGVDRAIDYAYETREHFPDRTIYVTNEIIHNPFVNRRLREQGIRFFEDGYGPDDIAADDVVLLPAFGASVELVEQLKTRGCVIVDTTCGSVMNVWKRVKRYGADGFCSIVHGKHYHEETIATVSHAVAEGGHYLVVRDKAEAELVCDTIRGAGPDREAFMERFARATSKGFDPDRHLEKVGLANQTTMLASESLEISAMVEAAVRDRDGFVDEEKNFRAFDTICSATQDRQDAIISLGRRVELDRVLVVGGFNSSNTGHLCKIAARYAPAYHISGPEQLLSREQIAHQRPGETELTVAEGWLADAPKSFGITSGASTPDSIVGHVLTRLGELHEIDLTGMILAAAGDRVPATKSGESREPLPLHLPKTDV